MDDNCEIVEREYSFEKIDRICCDISYADFFEKYMLRNIPCVIKEDITKPWLSRELWVSGNKPNFPYLQAEFGPLMAPVANCKENYYGSQKKDIILISEFLSYWEEYILKNYPVDMPILYLKDWHLKKELPDSSYYEVPLYFGSDWLNEFWSARNDISDDYRFVYMGPKGSWTPEHVDVFSSYSWSANIVGRKKWLFYPPKSKGSGQTPFTTDEQSLEDRKVIELIQESGEVVFVPSGWRHEVFNLEDTISINHNWVNACNLENWMWPSLKAALHAVEMELKDCLQEGMEAWEEQCQVLLQAVHGIDFVEFYAFLRVLAEHRLHFLVTTDRFSNTDVIIHQRKRETKSVNDSQSLQEMRQNSISVGSYENLGVAKEESFQLCFDHKPLKVALYKPSNYSLARKVMELKSEAVSEKECTAMVCENGCWLGMLHAFYDIWKIQKVMESLMSHHCIPKLEFFQKLTSSKSHQQFMHKLNVLIHHTESRDILKLLNRFT